jgi:hypothetical protein
LMLAAIELSCESGAADESKLSTTAFGFN